jgi:hypothetical protein
MGVGDCKIEIELGIGGFPEKWGGVNKGFSKACDPLYGLRAELGLPIGVNKLLRLSYHKVTFSIFHSSNSV